MKIGARGSSEISRRTADCEPDRSLASGRFARSISAMLFAVRNFSLCLTFLLAASISALLSPAAAEPAPQPVAHQQGEPQSEPPAPQQIHPAPVTPQSTPGIPPAPAGPFIVLDPAHGGTDPGAHSEGGSVEKDIVLRIAQTVRAELERQGYRVAMTRYDDSNPSYDDRAAVANTYRGAIFISLHISSTGTPGTARAYYHQFGTPIPSPSTATDANTKTSAPPPGDLTRWEEAQRPYVEASHHLADIIQRELAQFFSGSPISSSGVAVRGLRSIAAPAVAIEISSVSGPSPNSLAAAAVPIATAIARSIAVFRPLAPGETK